MKEFKRNVKLSEIKPYMNNPRKNDEAVDHVLESIKQFGFVQPIMVDENYEIITGHTRFKAALKAELKGVDVLITDELPGEKKRAYRIRDNRSGEIAEWDFKLLAEEARAFDEEDRIMLGWPAEQMNEWINTDWDQSEFEGQTDDDEIPEDVESICKMGDLWQLGRHRLLCGDATKENDAKRLMNGDKISLGLTDPPYNVDIDYKTYNDSKTELEYIKFSKDWFKTIRGRVNVLIFTPGTGRNLINYDLWWGIERPYWQCIWIKKNAMTHSPIGGFQNYEPIFIYGKPETRIGQDVFDYPVTIQSDVADDKGNKLHPTPKQISLWVKLTEEFTKPLDIVCDPFIGSGTTLIACEKTNRICYGMEIDPHYCDVIIKRWENYTGKKAEKIK